MTRKKKTTKKVEGEPNVAFIGKETFYKEVDGKQKKAERIMSDAPDKFNRGSETFPLPDRDTQVAGFYLPFKIAKALTVEHPTMYKIIKTKG